ncbi:MULTISPECIES: hypothetical protein [unclassified Bacillus (in: firmicutes)]|uniref:hypothetical protein n=1 Tax=unclassified Bacillus (in: firmicutes) TaxID=185979 RepID=UPI000CDCF0CA|nr:MULTISPECIES: hypothetical protein [unclassified Bacillus (in: firmicutes)]MDO3660140.1 hypothetical protein [Bacillus sp. C28GYM-DRY-1]POX34464.1 hypothetical protein C3465_07380 [Bacillus sp. Ru63]
MDFKIYRVFEKVNYEGKEHEVQDYLNNLDFFDAGQNLKYVINSGVEYERGVLVGSISEEFIPNSYKVNEDRTLGNLEGFEPYERTIFAYDFNTNIFLVQNRKYPPKNLDPGRTLNRLTDIMNDAFRSVFNDSFTVIQTTLPEGNEMFLNWFKVNRVTEVEVSNINQRGTLREDVYAKPSLNSSLKEFWNVEDDSKMDVLKVRSTMDGELNNNPIVLAAIHSPDVIIDKIRYYDAEEDKQVTVQRSKLDKFVVKDVARDEESVTAFQQVINQVNENRRILRNIRSEE